MAMHQSIENQRSSALDDGRLSVNALGNRVYQVLWDRILDRRVDPGEKLSDLRLSAEFGVSRTPVREALQRLVQEGVVRAETNRGFYVASYSAKDIQEIYDLRATLEAMALKLGASEIEPKLLESDLSDLDRIESAYQMAETDGERLLVANEFLDVDRGFHRTIVARANNSRLTSVVEGLWAQIAVFQRTGARRGWTELSIGHHRRIIWALLALDLPAAASALEEHILEIKGLVVAELEHDHRSRREIRKSRRERLVLLNGDWS